MTVADSSVLFPHVRGWPMKFSLKFLAQNLLGTNIRDNKHGHCSEEDAQTAMKLFQLKMKNGLKSITVQGHPSIQLFIPKLNKKKKNNQSETLTFHSMDYY
jgi:DNA polymerase III epsilon subunit-like protein